jgi:hypothetical protein
VDDLLLLFECRSRYWVQIQEQYPWLDVVATDLKLGEIPALLAEYKRLARADIDRRLARSIGVTPL